MKKGEATKGTSRDIRKLKCSHCKGRGAYSGSICKICMGKGWVLR